jgi:D-alanyl-D-alanine carboxypeptidase
MPPVPPDAPPLASFAGRFASLWGIVDIAELGGRLVLVRPTAADPLPQIEEVEVLDAATLRVAAQPGFGAPGELLPVERDAAGQVTSLRLAGVTSRPVEEFLRRRSGLPRPEAGDPAT